MTSISKAPSGTVPPGSERPPASNVRENPRKTTRVVRDFSNDNPGPPALFFVWSFRRKVLVSIRELATTRKLIILNQDWHCYICNKIAARNASRAAVEYSLNVSNSLVVYNTVYNTEVGRSDGFRFSYPSKKAIGGRYQLYHLPPLNERQSDYACNPTGVPPRRFRLTRTVPVHGPVPVVTCPQWGPGVFPPPLRGSVRSVPRGWWMDASSCMAPGWTHGRVWP